MWILNAAGVLSPPGIRPLDAIHLASAQELGRDLGQLVTYDEAMLAAAGQLGLNTAAPT